MAKTFYGITHPDQIWQHTRAVCDALGHGSTNQAMNMILRTIAQETGMGTIKDPSIYGAGIGLCQIDPIAFEDVKTRTRKKDVDALETAFHFEWYETQHIELAMSPLLSIIWCRAFYKLIPEVFPSTLELQADYWKRRYNTEMGKGTAHQFIHNAIAHGLG